jgi:diacylglycerol kinase (ATP)
LGVTLRIAHWEWVVLTLTIGLVLAAEGFNTAIEATVDLATRDRHPLARIAKDVAAGSVLICALTAVVVGVLIFGPRLWALWLILST